MARFTATIEHSRTETLSGRTEVYDFEDDTQDGLIRQIADNVIERIEHAWVDADDAIADRGFQQYVVDCTEESV